MDYKLNHLSNVEKEVEITFPAEEVTENFKQSILHLSKTVSVNGFRKGKIPLNVIRQRYKSHIVDEVQNYLITKAFQETISKEKLSFASAPTIFDQSELKEGESFSLKYKVEVFPNIDIEVKPFEAEYSPLVFKEEMVDRELEGIKKRFVEYKESKDELTAEKDRLTISFSGKIGEEEISGTQGKGVSAILGEKRFVPDFENALLNRKEGESFTAEVKFPEDYHGEEIAGKTVLFSITVDKVEKHAGEPELTDEFLAGKEGYPDTLAELKEALEKEILAFIDNVNLDNKKYIAAKTYIDNYDIEVPPSILKGEVEARVEGFKAKNKIEEVEESEKKKLEEDALWATKRYIIMKKLSEKLSITVTEKDINDAIAKDAMSYGLPPEYVEHLRKHYTEEQLNAKKEEILDSKVLERIAESMVFKVKEEEKEEEKNDEEKS
ncbi:MAG: trigger factor [bacterium]